MYGGSFMENFLCNKIFYLRSTGHLNWVVCKFSLGFKIFKQPSYFCIALYVSKKQLKIKFNSYFQKDNTEANLDSVSNKRDGRIGGFISTAKEVQRKIITKNAARKSKENILLTSYERSKRKTLEANFAANMKFIKNHVKGKYKFLRCF